MSFVAVAIGGAAVVGAVGTNIAANRAGAAAERGASTAAGATIESTRMQIEEIARQFDYQQQILLPQIQQQYNAQGAFADLLGIGGFQSGDQGGADVSQLDSQLENIRQQMIAINRGRDTGPDPQGRLAQLRAERDQIYAQREQALNPSSQSTGPQFPTSGATQFQRGPNGEFIDPNLDPTRLADVNTYGDTVRGNLQAGTSAEADPYRNYIDQNRIAAASAGEDAQVRRANEVTMTGARGDISLGAMREGASLMDERGNILLADGSLADDTLRQDIAGRSLAEGAAGQGVYGETFEASPGYAFAVEEANRATDRLRSRGGNYGGRALIEANRRAIGVANQEYYNWAAGRSRDVDRLAGAEAQDASRLDASAYDFQRRRDQDVARGDQFAGIDIARGDQFAQYDIGRGDQFAGSDIARGDQALAGYENQRIADVGRGDAAYQDYLRRREGDAARLDSAAQQEDALLASDRARSDQAYYNYIANLGQVAGFGGGPAASAVNASQAAGAQTSAAYGRQGSSLSDIYGNLGATNAQIEGQRAAGISNALISGAENYVTYRGSKPLPPPTSGG